MQALVQLRGDVNMDGDVHDTLDMLNIHNVNHATFVPEEDTYRGMVTKVNDYVAFGEPSVETVEQLIDAASLSRAMPTSTTPGSAKYRLLRYRSARRSARRRGDHAARAGSLADAPTAPAPWRSRGHQTPGDRRCGELGRHETEKMDALLEAMR